MNLVTLESKKSMVWPPLHRELEAAGHTLFTFQLEEKVKGYMNWNGGYMKGRLLTDWTKVYSTIANRCPDAILAINNLGLINGPLIQWCEDNKTPLIVWYMDDPLYLKVSDQWKDREYLHCLCYCQAHADRLHEWGVKNTGLLSAATDEKRFCIDPNVERDLDLVFVGDTGVNRIQAVWDEIRKSLGPAAWRSAESWLETTVNWAAEELRKSGLGPFEFCNEAFDHHHPIYPWINKIGSHLVALIDIRATHLDRKETVLALAKGHPIHVYGDGYWEVIKKEFDSEGLVYHGPVLYKDVHKVYQRTKVLVDIPRYQTEHSSISLGVNFEVERDFEVKTLTQRDLDGTLCGCSVVQPLKENPWLSCRQYLVEFNAGLIMSEIMHIEVLDDYTYSHRAQDLTNYIERITNERPSVLVGSGSD